ncbi:MAG: hypothetical protein ACRDAP_10105 [Shewanella sp.]
MNNEFGLAYLGQMMVKQAMDQDQFVKPKAKKCSLLQRIRRKLSR